VRREKSMIFSNDRTTKDAQLNTLGEELAAAWVRFYAIEVDMRKGTCPSSVFARAVIRIAISGSFSII
jgi:hypothetical protein